MARPIEWARDLHLLREKASRSRTETWSRQEVEHLFGVGRATAQTLMKAIGEVATVGGAHFVERPALIGFLDSMLNAPSVEEALRARLAGAAPVPRPNTLRVSLPPDLRHAMLPDLPANITLEPGRLEVRAGTAEGMLESLVALAMVMQNDLERFRSVLESPTELVETPQFLCRDQIMTPPGCTGAIARVEGAPSWGVTAYARVESCTAARQQPGTPEATLSKGLRVPWPSLDLWPTRPSAAIQVMHLVDRDLVSHSFLLYSRYTAILFPRVLIWALECLGSLQLRVNLMNAQLHSFRVLTQSEELPPGLLIQESRAAESYSSTSKGWISQVFRTRSVLYMCCISDVQHAAPIQSLHSYCIGGGFRHA